MLANGRKSAPPKEVGGHNFGTAGPKLLVETSPERWASQLSGDTLNTKFGPTVAKIQHPFGVPINVKYVI